jgi:hypothetical protein
MLVGIHIYTKSTIGLHLKALEDREKYKKNILTEKKTKLHRIRSTVEQQVLMRRNKWMNAGVNTITTISARYYEYKVGLTHTTANRSTRNTSNSRRMSGAPGNFRCVQISNDAGA